MGIKRYIANVDTTITNAYKLNLSTRGTGSNMGASDVLEVFSIYAQAASSSAELSRILVKFPTADISTDRTAGTVPASGSVSFYLRMFNCKHAFTLPRDFKLVITPLNVDWEEGIGLDMENYQDETKDSIAGANWINRVKGTAWTTPGAARNQQDLYGLTETVTFNTGSEDLEVDISRQVEDWLASTYTNNGLLISLTSSQEAYVERSDDNSIAYQNTTGSKASNYTKKFFSRTSEFFYKRPMIEARWNSAKKDDRNNFYYSSSLVPQIDNLNTVYFYNYVRGTLKDIPDVSTGPIYVTIFSGNVGNTAPTTASIKLPQGGGVTASSTGYPTYVTGGHVSTGIYSASFALTGARSALTEVYDVWSNTADRTQSGYIQYHTGTISPKEFVGSNINPSPEYSTTITNLKSTYRRTETPIFRLFVREKDWSPSIYTKATAAAKSTIIQSGSYRIVRAIDNYDVVPYGTGSDLYSHLSYDVSGNYFDFNMGLLEDGYAYKIKLSYYVNNDHVEQSEEFKFRVE